MTIEYPQHWLRVDAFVAVVKVRIHLMNREDVEVIVNVKKCTAMSKSTGKGFLIHGRMQYSVRYGKDWLWVALAHVTFKLYLTFDRSSNHALKRCIIVEIFFSIFVFMLTCLSNMYIYKLRKKLICICVLWCYFF